jgi:predicted nucleic acid-binding protein
MKIILDTNILISALVFERVCEEVITKWIQNSEIEVFCSSQIWVEIENKFLGGRVLDLTQKSKRNIGVAEIDGFLKMYKESVNFVNVSIVVDN